jgi:CubicO group peptidase (beta-lactamase class C family)
MKHGRIFGGIAVTMSLFMASAMAQQSSFHAPTSPAAHSLIHDDLESWFDGYVPYNLQRGNIAGAVVVVVKDGQVVFQKGYGYSDVESRRPFDAETTVLRPGSVSKLMTWTAVMQLVEQGKINLDTDINGYLNFKIPPFQGKPITMRNLMTHTPGFAASYTDLVKPYPERIPPLGEYLKHQLPDRILAAGEVPAYSNYGAALAGYIVQRVSGLPFDDYMDQFIFHPLDMAHSTFRQPISAQLQPFMASGYKLASDPAKPYEMFAIAPAGSSAVTGADMAKFMIAHLQDGEYKGQRILQSATAHLMHDTRFTSISPSVDSMLLGFYEFDRNGHRIIGHEGDTLWFHSVLQLFVDDHVGLFISMNSLGNDNASRSLRKGLEDDFADRYFPAGVVAHVALSSDIARTDAAKIVGQYYPSLSEPNNILSLGNLFQQSEVTSDAAGHIQASSVVGVNGQAIVFEEVAPFVWNEVGGKERLAAKVVDGKVIMWGADAADSATIANLPVSPWLDAVWLVPALIASLAALLLTAVLWPISILVRRHYRVPFKLVGQCAQSYRWVRIGAAASSILMLSWLSTVAIMVVNFYFRSTLQPWFLTLHILSDFVFPLTVYCALWDGWHVWTTRKGRGWWGSSLTLIWSAILILSSCTLLWVATAFHLIGIDVNF